MNQHLFRTTIVFSLMIALLFTACGSTNATSPTGNGGTPTPSSQGGGEQETKQGQVPRTDVKGAPYPPQPIEADTDGDFNPPDATPLPEGPYRPIPAEPPTAPPLDLKQQPALKTSALFGSAIPRSPTDDITFTRLTGFSANAQGWETSGASAGSVVWATGNGFAAYSSTGGANFTGINPTTIFPAADGGYCGDQVAEYVPATDIVAYTYLTCPANGKNRVRLAVASPAGITSSNGTAWGYYDLTSDLFGLGSKWIDYESLGLGANALYLTANIIGGSAIVMRFPLNRESGLGAGTMTFQYYVDATGVRNYHIAQNSGQRAFWVAPANTSTVRVFHWDETSGTLFWNDVGIGSTAFSGYSSTTPDGQNWFGHTGCCAERHWIGVTLNGSTLWIAHTAGTDAVNGHNSPYPRPYIYLAQIDVNSYAMAAQHAIWNPDFAWGYPSLATNANNEVGIAFGWGGGTRYTNTGTGIMTGTERLYNLTGSTAGITRWGDYTTIRTYAPNTRLFETIGYGITTTNDPVYALFGRSSDV